MNVVSVRIDPSKSKRGWRWRSRLYCWCIEKIGRSKGHHIAIGVGPSWWSRGYEGTQWVNEDKISNIVDWADVHEIGIVLPHTAQKISEIRTVLWWITGGRVWSDNCVTSASQALRSAGIPVPRNATTPDKLLHFLRERQSQQAQGSSAGCSQGAIRDAGSPIPGTSPGPVEAGG